MRALLLTTIALMVFFGFPLLSEDTGSECGALAMRVAFLSSEEGVSQNSFVNGLTRSFGDAVTNQAVRARYPGYPPALACSAYYWKTVIAPRSAGELFAISDPGNPTKPPAGYAPQKREEMGKLFSEPP